MAKKDKEYILRPEIWLKELQKKKKYNKEIQTDVYDISCLSIRKNNVELI